MLSDGEVAEVFVARWRTLTSSWLRNGKRQVGRTPLLNRYYYTGIAANEDGNTPYGVFNIRSRFVAVDGDGFFQAVRYEYAISVRVSGDVETLLSLSPDGSDESFLDKKLNGTPWPWAGGYGWPDGVDFFGPAVRDTAEIDLYEGLRNGNDMVFSAFGIRFTLGFVGA